MSRLKCRKYVSFKINTKIVLLAVKVMHQIKLYVSSFCGLENVRIFLYFKPREAFFQNSCSRKFLKINGDTPKKESVSINQLGEDLQVF